MCARKRGKNRRRDPKEGNEEKGEDGIEFLVLCEPTLETLKGEKEERARRRNVGTARKSREETVAA